MLRMHGFLYNRSFSVHSVLAIRKLAEEASNWCVLRDVDVFHCHGLFSNFETSIGLYLSKCFQKPIIFQLHGHFGAASECMNLDHGKALV